MLITREGMNLHYLHSFMTDLNLIVADLPFHFSIHHTYMRDDGCVHSWPDHFLCDSLLRHHLTQFDCLDYGSNLSDNLPLSCTLSVDLSSSSSPPPSSFSTKNHVSWKAATIDQIAQLPLFLDSVRDCCDLSCTLHLQVLDDFCARLSDCLNDSALFSLPTIRVI